jgi:hypothetical protein
MQDIKKQLIVRLGWIISLLAGLLRPRPEYELARPAYPWPGRNKALSRLGQGFPVIRSGRLLPPRPGPPLALPAGLIVPAGPPPRIARVGRHLPRPGRPIPAPMHSSATAPRLLRLGPAPARPDLFGRGSRLPGRAAPSSIAPGRYCLARLDPQHPWPALLRPGDSARTPRPWPACKASSGQSTSSATSLAGSFTMLYIGLGTPLAQTGMPSSQSYPQEEDKIDD